MHFISQIHYNPSTGADDFYYRIKESVRDLTGRVHSYVLLNVGFMTPRLKPGQVRDIAICLNWLSEHRGEQDLFGDAMSRFDEIVRSRAMEYWQQMASLGTIDRARKIIEEAGTAVTAGKSENRGQSWVKEDSDSDIIITQKGELCFELRIIVVILAAENVPRHPATINHPITERRFPVVFMPDAI